MGAGKVVKLKHNNTEPQRYIEFCMGPKNYAIPLIIVREIISVPDIDPVSKSAPYFLGVINLRNQVISIIDLRKKLKIESVKNKEEAILIIEIEGAITGLVVDSIKKVLTFSLNEVKEIENPLETNYVFGIYKKEYSSIILLDLIKVLELNDSKKAV